MKNLTPVFAALIALSSPAHAERTKVQDHYKNIINQEPYSVEICRNVKVPHGSGTSNSIISGIIGGVLGNQFGSGEGKIAMTGFGALTGAILGGQEQQGSYIERQCGTETRYREEPARIYSHSSVSFSYAGKSYRLKFEK